jgi:hypothetical protein
VIAISAERAALNNPVLLGYLAVAVKELCHDLPVGGEEVACSTVLEEHSRRKIECASVVRGRREKALRRCQVKVDLILDEVESKVHVVSTEFIYHILYPNA